jgi:hypothetical protein
VLVLAIALTGLAMDGNWPKVLRVAGAGGTYLITLLAIGTERAAPVRWRVFFAAGLAAGVVSGLLRPAVDLAIVATGALGGGLLLGSVHWLALRSWRRLLPAPARDGRPIHHEG